MEPTQLAATTRNEVGLDIDRISGPLVQWFLPGKHQNCRHTRGRACHRSVTGAHAAATGGCSLWMLHHIKPPMSQPVARGPITGIRSPASSRWLPFFSGFGFVFVLRSLSQPRPGSGTCTHTSAPYIPPPTHDHSTQPLVSFRFGFLFSFFFFPFLLLRFSFPLSLSASLSLLLLSTTPVHFARLSLWILFLVLSIKPTSHRCHTAASLTFNRRTPPGFCLQAGITPATEEKSLPRFVRPSLHPQKILKISSQNLRARAGVGVRSFSPPPPQSSLRRLK